MKTIYTVGHGLKPSQNLISLVKPYATVLIDCRSIPFSSRNPSVTHFNLKTSCDRMGLKYILRKDLGGLNSPSREQHERGLDEIVSQMNNGEVLCLMCSESDPNDCHRKSKLTPILLEKGFEIIHILHTGKLVSESTAKQHTML